MERLREVMERLREVMERLREVMERLREPAQSSREVSEPGAGAVANTAGRLGKQEKQPGTVNERPADLSALGGRMRGVTGMWRLWGVFVGAGLLAGAGCHHGGAPVGVVGPGGSGGAGSGAGPGGTAISPPSGIAAPLEPDARMTPGATLPVTKDDICVSGYSKKVRDVPEDVKRQAYAEYNIPRHQPGEFEVDHLISLELGGSNSIKNLWPQSYKTQPWNAHVKDQLENALHADVCSDRTDLGTAQRAIATDWIGAYKREFHTDAPLAVTSGKRHRRAASPAPDAGDGDYPVPAGPGTGAAVRPAAMTSAPSAGGQVWVNLKSGKYFYAGARYYGKTKSGQYMSEAAAQKQGYVAAQGQSGAPAQ